MPHSVHRRRLLAALSTATAGGLAFFVPGAAAPAAAAEVVTVAGIAFPDASAGFAYVGCSDFLAPGGAPSARVRDIDGTPYGQRSTGFTTGGGTGAGPRSEVTSVAELGTLGVNAWSDAGADGFAYVWLFPADDTAHAWLGRTPVGADGGFGRVDVAGSSFSWTRYDRDGSTLTSPVEDGTGTPADAAARHGDGPGQVGFAYGCNGADFSLDGFTVGSRVYDFEGIDLTTTMRTGALDRRAQLTSLSGVTTGAGRVSGEPLVLERRRPGESRFTPVDQEVEVTPAGVYEVAVRPTADTQYRWRRLDVSYAVGGYSDPVTVTGRARPAELGGAAERRERRPSTPTEPTEPTEPTPTEPTEPTEPTPTEPTPTEPTPTEPTPTEPTEPAPTEPPVEDRTCEEIADDTAAAEALGAPAPALSATDLELDLDGDGDVDVDDCADGNDPEQGASATGPEQGIREDGEQ